MGNVVKAAMLNLTGSMVHIMRIAAASTNDAHMGAEEYMFASAISPLDHTSFTLFPFLTLNLVDLVIRLAVGLPSSSLKTRGRLQPL
jgi:hypothetical protein